MNLFHCHRAVLSPFLYLFVECFMIMAYSQGIIILEIYAIIQSLCAPKKGKAIFCRITNHLQYGHQFFTCLLHEFFICLLFHSSRFSIDFHTSRACESSQILENEIILLQNIENRQRKKNCTWKKTYIK